MFIYFDRNQGLRGLFFHNPSFYWFYLHFVYFQVRILFAPFFYVGFADFWLADQLTSLVPALLDFQYLVCFYLTNDKWMSNKSNYALKSHFAIIYFFAFFTLQNTFAIGLKKPSSHCQLGLCLGRETGLFLSRHKRDEIKLVKLKVKLIF